MNCFLVRVSHIATFVFVFNETYVKGIAYIFMEVKVN